MSLNLENGCMLALDKQVHRQEWAALWLVYSVHKTIHIWGVQDSPGATKYGCNVSYEHSLSHTITESREQAISSSVAYRSSRWTNGAYDHMFLFFPRSANNRLVFGRLGKGRQSIGLYFLQWVDVIFIGNNRSFSGIPALYIYFFIGMNENDCIGLRK